MNQTELKEKFELILKGLEKNDALNLENITSEKYLNIVNRYDYLIMLGDIEIYRPICLNNSGADFFGYDNNWLKDKDYFGFLKAIHPATYLSFLEIRQFYLKDISEYLFIDYKLLYQNKEWKVVSGITKVVLRKDGKPKYSITVGFFDKNNSNSIVNKLNKLTKREREIADYISSGLSNKEIAKKLNISSATIHTHKKNIYKKLNINKVSELVSINEKYSI